MYIEGIQEKSRLDITKAKLRSCAMNRRKERQRSSVEIAMGICGKSGILLRKNMATQTVRNSPEYSAFF